MSGGWCSWLYVFLFSFCLLLAEREGDTGGASVSSIPSLSVCREFAVFVFVFDSNDVAFTSDPQD